MKYMIFILILFAVELVACDPPFMSTEKIGVPSDHTNKIGNAMHKGEAGDPFSEGGCSDAECHGPDLRGDVATTDSGLVRTSSCYQCHGAKWEGEDD